MARIVKQLLVQPGQHVKAKDLLLVENPESREWRTLAEKLNWAASPGYNASPK